VQLYSARLSQAPATEAIKLLLAETEMLRQQEMAKALQRMAASPLSAEQTAALEALTKSLAAKLVHPRIAALKHADTHTHEE
jgi:glutamyl-tRNA reductase